MESRGHAVTMCRVGDDHVLNEIEEAEVMHRFVSLYATYIER